MSLSCPSLPIGEDSAIIPFENALDDGQGCLLEYSFLVASGLESHIEAEDSFFFSCIFGAMDDDFSSAGNHIDD